MIIIDGDPIVYRAGFAAESVEYAVTFRNEAQELLELLFDNAKSVVNYSEENPSLDLVSREKVRTPAPVEHALHNTKAIVEDSIIEALGDNYFGTPVIVLSGETNFREDLATIKPYKGNRDRTHRPAHGDAIKQYLECKYETIYTKYEEADDAVGYLHYESPSPSGSCICTTDKDLDMIPGWHYNWVKKKLYNVNPWDALVFFYEQLLQGDATDNIPGIPGVGPKTAEAALLPCTNFGEMKNVVVEFYRNHYGGDWDYCLEENGRLLWIRRKPFELWGLHEKNMLNYEKEAELWKALN